MRLQKVASVLLWCNLVPALWSGFVAAVGAMDSSFSVKDVWSISAFAAYILIALLEVIFFVLFLSTKMLRAHLLWLIALVISAILTTGAFVTTYSLKLWATATGGALGVVLLAYAVFICVLTFKGMRKAYAAEH